MMDTYLVCSTMADDKMRSLTSLLMNLYTKKITEHN